MNDCIEREKAIELIQPHVKPQTVYGKGYLQAIEHATDILELMPAADVQPVKHGRWKHIAGMNSKCSECERYFPVQEFDSRPFDINFCPHCGARMDGEQNG